MSDERRWSRRLFRILLLAYPKRIRLARGDDMWLTFERHLRDARSSGWYAVFELWRREVIALWRGRKRARVFARKRRRAPRRSVEAERTKRFTASGMSWLDFKLGFRMLVKYPGLSVVGGFGMAVAIAIGAGSFGVIYSLMDPALPLEEGERVVSIQNWSTAFNNPHRQSLRDFVTWREELRSVEELGAWTATARNLVTSDGRAEPVRIAVMTASGFRVTRVPPLLGRTLGDEDERKGAPPVVVIGYHVWQHRFDGDPDVVGRSLRLGGTVHTVVGVMPQGFAFPLNHRIWTPLRADRSDYEWGQGPAVFIFGRIAAGVTLGEVRAELTTIARRIAAASPDTHEHLQPKVMPYTYPFFDIDNPATVLSFHLVQVLISMLLVVVCVNVAILVYARTAMRRREIAVRSALGASRRRVVAQFFVEALVLSAAAATVGLVVAGLVLREVNVFVDRLVSDELPFWLNFGLSSGTVIYVAGITVLAAAIVGVLPAVKATGRRVHAGLRQLDVGGSGMQLGGTWTVLIVAQVAIAVSVLPAAGFQAWQSGRYGIAEPGFAAEEFLTARLFMDAESPPTGEAGANRNDYAARYADRHAELVRRLDTDAGVSDVTFSMYVPGEEPQVWIEVDGRATPTPARPTASGVRPGTVGHTVRLNRVDIDLFDVFDVPILTGRRFQAEDLDSAATAVIVNRTFVLQVLGGGDALGRRVFRYADRGRDAGPDAAEPGRWHEIVGVVSDFPNAIDPERTEAKLYHPTAPGRDRSVSLAVRVQGTDPATFAGRFREITAGMDPTLRLGRIRTLDEVLREMQLMRRGVALAIVLVTLSVLLLSAAGIYALMSFTVTQRRREIGIRTALGAHPRRVLGSIFTRAAIQLAIGVVVGVLGLALVDGMTGGDVMGGQGAVLLPAVAAIMMAVGLLAALGPARRGLRIQPTEALRET